MVTLVVVSYNGKRKKRREKSASLYARPVSPNFAVLMHDGVGVGLKPSKRPCDGGVVDVVVGDDVVRG